MQVLPGHLLAASKSRLSRVQHQICMESEKKVGKNTGFETLAYTKTILVRPYPAANNSDRNK